MPRGASRFQLFCGSVILYSSCTTWLFFHLLYVSFSCLQLIRNSLFTHAPPVTMAWFPAYWNRPFLSLEEMFETNKFLWVLSLSRVVSHGILASRTLNRSKFTLLKSKVKILLFTLIPPLRILNSTVSGQLQPTANILNQFFLFCNDQVLQSMSLHQQHCHPCCEFITPMHSRNFLDCLSFALLAFQQILDIL